MAAFRDTPLLQVPPADISRFRHRYMEPDTMPHDSTLYYDSKSHWELQGVFVGNFYKQVKFSVKISVVPGIVCEALAETPRK